MPYGHSTASTSVSEPIATPKVLHVTTAGNDTTGDGSLANPYQTGTKAFTVALALTGQNICIQFGVGAFTCTAAGVWPSRISVKGMGPLVTTLTLTTTDNVILWSDRSIAVVLTATGSGPGVSGPDITFYNVYGSIFTQGEPGATGTQGTPGSAESPSGDGGPGDDGGNGGNIDLMDSFCTTVETLGGAGGEGGPPGIDGGGGLGDTGAAGNAGSRGDVLLLRSHVTSLTCAAYDMGCSNVHTITEGIVGSDYGGNSNMPIPSL